MYNVILNYIKQPKQLKGIANSIKLDAIYELNGLERKLNFSRKGKSDNGNSAGVYGPVIDTLIASGIVDIPYF